MTDINLRSDVIVQLSDWMGDDSAIVRAMLVSTQGGEVMEDSGDNAYGRLNFLMKNRHGTPFEHSSMTFYIEAPISVFREFHRHRIGWSYNEMSGRYKELEPNFYVPRSERPLVQEGKPGHYTFVSGSREQYEGMADAMQRGYQYAYATYQELLADGIAKEVARQVLPVGIYSSMFATCNPRSLMAFLSLRTKEEGSKFPSYPMDEIELVARKMEAEFASLFPLTYKTFNENGRVAP